MSQATQETTTPVPPEEVARRIREMRQLAFQGKHPPVVVYHPPQQPCPWPGCGYRIAGILFRLETIVKAEDMEDWLAAWWLGPGLIGRCPGCHQFVLFDVLRKEAVPDPTAIHAPRLPDDWYEKTHQAPRGGG